MNCTDLLSHLSDYFDDQLTAELREEISVHTSGCQHCRVVLNTTHQTIEVYKGAELYEVSPELRDRLHNAIMTKCLAKK
jgi:anti-sigma factor RsiW